MGDLKVEDISDNSSYRHIKESQRKTETLLELWYKLRDLRWKCADSTRKNTRDRSYSGLSVGWRARWNSVGHEGQLESEGDFEVGARKH